MCVIGSYCHEKMPRGTKESEDEFEPRGRQTRATVTSGTDSPVRRSTSNRQTTKNDNSSSESVTSDADDVDESCKPEEPEDTKKINTEEMDSASTADTNLKSSFKDIPADDWQKGTSDSPVNVEDHDEKGGSESEENIKDNFNYDSDEIDIEVSKKLEMPGETFVMSSDHPFRWVPSLQHMASIKIIETLWRNVEDDKQMIKETLMTQYHCRYGVNLMLTDWHNMITPIRKKLEITVNGLQFPPGMKYAFKSFLIQMINGVASWWRDFAEVVHEALGCERDIINMTSEQKSAHWDETIILFVDQIKWTNIGCIDVKTMLKSYVSNKKMINFCIWRQLCLYGIEEDIKKFTTTLNWNNCREFFDSHNLVFWYHKIFGKFPTKEMFFWAFWSLFERNRKSGFYDEENIMRNMLIDSRTISMIMYCRNHLKENDEFNECLAKIDFHRMYNVGVYVFRVMDKSTLFNFIENNDNFGSILDILIIMSLTSWPSICFIDDWISIFETISDDFIISFLKGLGPEMKYLDESGKYCTFYEPFQKVWRLFSERCIDDLSLSQAFDAIFSRQDVILCNIIFNEIQSDRRKVFLNTLENFFHENREWQVDRAFCELLEDDEVKKLFRKARGIGNDND